MDIVLNFIIAGSLGLLIVSFVQLIRVHFLSKLIQAEVRNTSEKRQAVLASGGSWKDADAVPYPDINQCYKNLKWYKPWERSSDLVVFEKD